MRLACIIIVSLGLASTAFGQEMHHAPSEMALHDQFYSHWMRPNIGRLPTGERTYSCCGKGDCYPTRFKRENGHWYFARKTMGPDGERHENGEWAEVPSTLIESHQPDPVESPDGGSHICESGYHVFCAVLGAQN